jgi:hypothetical protein
MNDGTRLRTCGIEKISSVITRGLGSVIWAMGDKSKVNRHTA